MHTSMGSGYCDCGDIEAWSNDYFCKLHIPNKQKEEEMKEEQADNFEYFFKILNKILTILILDTMVCLHI
jgi:hypothetical protein